MVIYAGIQYIPGGLRVLTQAELVDPHPQAVLVVEAESQGQGHIEETWGCDNGITDPQLLQCVIKISLRGCELLSLGGVCQCLLYLRELPVLCHLGQAQEVG